VILQVVRLFESDTDHVADCFLFVCKQLNEQGFKRLRRFQVVGPATFVTWLRAVVRRLCLDWRRKEFGRTRIFESVARLSAFDRDLFRYVYQQGLSPDEALQTVAPRFPSLSGHELAGGLERIRGALTPRQFWLLSTCRPRFEPLVNAETGADSPLLGIIPDPGPDPEALAAQQQEHSALAAALGKLPDSERLLVRLRFEHDLTLEQVARVAGLPDAQTADRRLRKILETLRTRLGKTRSASV
jgi:RNA polymerase sigma factor (sigma-70 family)